MAPRYEPFFFFFLRFLLYYAILQETKGFIVVREGKGMFVIHFWINLFPFVGATTSGWTG